MADTLEKFVGKWKMDRSENADALFSAMGMNFFLRKMISMAKPEQIFTIEGDVIKIKISTAVMTREEEIKLGEEYEKHEEKMGAKFRCKAHVEDGKLIVEQEAIEGGNVKLKRQMITREIIEDELVQTIRMFADVPSDDVICKRWFKKIE